MKKRLTRDDIEGQVIKHVFRTMYNNGDISICNFYVQLANGIAFELIAFDDDNLELYEIHLKQLGKLLLADNEGQIKGSKIIKLVSNFCYPCMSILTRSVSGKINLVFIDVFPYLFNVYVKDIEQSDYEDCFDFWDNSPIDFLKINNIDK